MQLIPRTLIIFLAGITGEFAFVDQSQAKRPDYVGAAAVEPATTQKKVIFKKLGMV